MITMDGNFQLKRKAKKNDAIDDENYEGIFKLCSSEAALWGSNDEVIYFDNADEEEKDVSF